MIRPDRTTVYAVYWPAEGVLKVGRCWRSSRYRELCATGGEVVFLMRDVPTRWELCALAQLDEHFPPAFERAADSEHLLPRGRGFTECFTVAPADLADAIGQIYEGIARYGDDKTTNGDTRGVSAGGAAEPAAGGATDGDLAAPVCGRSRAGESEPAPHAGELLSARRGDDRADDRRAPAVAGRCRMPRALRRGRVDVLRADGLANGRPGETVSVSGAAPRERFANASRSIRGEGEGERKRGREGERGRERSFTIPSRHDLRPLAVLPRPPLHRGTRRTLQGMRQSTTTAQGLGRRTDRRPSPPHGGARR